MSAPKTHEGFEVWFHNFKMQLNMYLYMFIALLVLHIFAAVTLFLVGGAVLTGALVAVISILPDDISSQIADFAAVQGASGITILLFLFSFLICFAIYPVAFPMLKRYFTRKAEKQQSDTHIRGAQVLTADELNKQMKHNKEKTDIPIGELKMPVNAETKHVLVVGRPGVGKTVLLSQVIDRLRDRDERSIIYDFKGDYLSRFYDKDRDLIFNPLDSRSVGWSVFNEVMSTMDIDAIAASLVPPSMSSQDPFWNAAARDVFAGILYCCHAANARKNKDVWDIVSADIDKIAKALKKVENARQGYVYIQDASGKQALSVHATLMQYAQAFRYMSDSDGDFSLSNWLESDKKNFIFVTSYANVKDSLTPILSLFVDLLARKLLSMQDSYDRRVFFILDEFGTLQRLSSIVQLLTLARSKGGSCWLGIQDIGQIEKIYTRDLRQAIVNSCGSSAIFSVADPNTADFLSSKIGEAEVEETSKNVQMGIATMRDGTSIQKHRKTRKVLLGSEIMELAELECLVKFGNYDTSRTKLTYKSYGSVADSFTLKPKYIL